MFSLIVSIISIALVAVLAAASIYYGGDAFTKGSAKALASTVVAQAQQISSANTLYKNDEGGTTAPTVQALVDGKYLASIPAAPSKVVPDRAAWTVASTFVSIDIDNIEVCKLINEQANGSANFVSGSQYGCFGGGADGLPGGGDDVTTLDGVSAVPADGLLFVYKG